MSKSKFFWWLVVIILIALALFLWKKTSTNRIKSLMGSASSQDGEQAAGNEEENINNDSGDNTGEQDVDYNAICENGEWVKIADVSGEAASGAGKLRRVYADDAKSEQFKNYLYYLEGSPSYGLTGADLSKLDPFEGREVEINGVKSSDGSEIAVSEVRCSGAETDKNVINSRLKTLDYIAASMNSIAPHKAKHKQWVVDTVDFVDNNDVYVEYYDAAENDESWSSDEDTSRKILLQISPKAGNNLSSSVLAYWEMGPDDYVLKEGADKFSDSHDLVSYQYNPEKNMWERIN